ncbi:hypothetical protein [Clostridium thermosuccinogenes]|uniref:hypothetical protein n=1 Tax=Clostridium thermosuccinogenes TaxID=84032 RepID=UPI000CCBE7AD|nr:hypothetical protein [Pseudoclostridium thermosuccinogenes]PNT91265.1 hypothetical protein CDQ83_15800 [Pseudoclostridium thermosuccinogenes]
MGEWIHYYDGGKEIYRKEEERLPKQTYWTKCGRQFKKNSTAAVTGYTIDFEDPQNEECTSCPFKIEVTDGWGDNKKFLRWECRAGSKEPNHKTEWVGSLDDKNTIQIHSLDYELMEEIRQYCIDHPELGASYNADHLADCRRTLSICCSQNKKGIAAKKTLIEKFFPETEAVPDEEQKCRDCKNWGSSFDRNNDLKYARCLVYDKAMHYLDDACPHFQSIENESTEQRCRVCGCTDYHACEGGCYWVEDDLCSRCAEFEENVLEICRQCENESTGCVPNNPEAGMCAAYVKKGENREVIYPEQKCKSKNTKCGYYCVHNEGCALVLAKGDALKTWMQHVGEVDCDVWREVSGTVQNPEVSLAENTVLEASMSNDVQPFDYSSVDEETAAFLQEKAVNIAQVNAISLAAIGKELKEAQDKLARKGYGCFQEWCQSLGVSKSSAYNYINVYNLFIQRVGQTEYLEKAPAKLLYEISKPSAKPELVEAVVSGDITTHKQYKELEEKLRKAEEALERQRENNKNIYESMERKDSEVIKYRKQAQEAEGKLNIREIEIQKLRQQLDQAKRNADPQKIQELGEIIREKQQEIEDLKKQLKDKPIEVPAVKVVEKVIEKVPEQSKYEVINRTYGTLLAAKLISRSDIKICREADFTRKNSIIEFLENLRDAIPEYLQILNEEVEQHKCEDCRYCDWEDLREEDEAAGMIYCTLNGDKQLHYNGDACKYYEQF